MKPFTLYFKAFIDVKNEKKSRKFIDKLEGIIEKKAEIIECGKYESDPKLFLVEVNFVLDVVDFHNAVFDAFEILNEISFHWLVSAPERFDTGYCQFEGTAAKGVSTIRIPEIHTMHFELHNRKKGERPEGKEGLVLRSISWVKKIGIAPSEEGESHDHCSVCDDPIYKGHSVYINEENSFVICIDCFYDWEEEMGWKCI